MVVPDVISLPVELEIFDLSLAAFATAAGMAGSVYGGPKWTVSPVYEGLLKEEMDAAAARHPEVQYFPTLIDATYAGLVAGARDGALVIPALNRDGDCFGLRWPARPSDRRSAGTAIRHAAISTAAEGIRTVDLGGDATTSEVADEVITRVRALRASAADSH